MSEYDKVPLIDLPPEGGGKSLVLPEITPYVARQISDFSTEDMRTDIEDELRAIARAVEQLTSAVKSLDARVTALEPKP